MFRSLLCEAKVAAASDFHLSNFVYIYIHIYIYIVFSEIRVPPLYGHLKLKWKFLIII